MSDIPQNRVTFERSDGQRVWFSVDGDFKLQVCDGVCHYGNMTVVALKESPAEAVAILNDALNPPGPGDVTWKQICDELTELNRLRSDGYTLVAHCDGSGYIEKDGQSHQDFGAHTTRHDPITAIASLMPKPAPDPRDELQESHDDLMGIVTKSHSPFRYPGACYTCKVIARAEALKEKP